MNEVEVDDADREACEWIRSRPVNVQQALIAFPPMCRVQILPNSPDRLSTLLVYRVVSYVETRDENDQQHVFLGLFSEEEYLRKEFTARQLCEQAFAKVIQYDGNKTPEFIQRILSGEDLVAENPGLEGRIEGVTP